MAFPKRKKKFKLKLFWEKTKGSSQKANEGGKEILEKGWKEGRDKGNISWGSSQQRSNIILNPKTPKPRKEGGNWNNFKSKNNINIIK